jgi:rhodanese-related sulfurtransferase
MAPLLPFEIISPGWGLVIMFLIGISFGFILEAAGFSSSRKLVGIFYGYDFVVLKVFFTAGLTAMIGLIFMQYFGFIDMSAVFINSNFLWSALAGGVIMGFGFILGGFCPGTSVTAAMIGKIDAWFFIAGIFIGIFIFGSFDTTFNRFFSGYYFDSEQLHDTLGMQRGWFVFFMIMMAVIAFAIGHYFEDKATQGLKPTNRKFSSYKMEIFFIILLGIIIIRIPEKSARSYTQLSEKTILKELVTKDRYIDADEFAYSIMHQLKDFHIIDVRTPQEFSQMNFPGSVNIPFETLADRRTKDIFRMNGRKVLVSNGETLAAKTWIFARRSGYRDVYVLKNGINGFIREIFYPQPPAEDEFRQDIFDDYRFRNKAASFFKEGEILLIAPAQKKVSVPADNAPKIAPSAGGC